jgi:serine/threonine protein phosphatase Stp1
MRGLRWSGLTHRGNRRTLNGDALLMVPERGVFAGWDGAVEAWGGDHAARSAVQLMGEALGRAGPGEQGGLGAMLERCGQALWALVPPDALEVPLLKIGATAAALWLREDGIAQVAHVGACRVYRWRGEELEALTRDHSLRNVMEATDAMSEEMFLSAGLQHVIVRSMGNRPGVAGVEVRELGWEPGDVYVLCTDGLSLDARELGRILSRGVSDVERVCEALMAEVLRGEAQDNVSVVVCCGDEVR